MFKTSSIDWKAVSTKDLIWIEAAFLVDGEISAKVKQNQFKLTADLRFLIKDLDDIQRLKITQGKKNALLSWYDLPSMANQKKPETNAQVRKAFLKNLSDSYQNK